MKTAEAVRSKNKQLTQDSYDVRVPAFSGAQVMFADAFSGTQVIFADAKDCLWEWSRRAKGSGESQIIEGANQRVYTPTKEDQGCVLQVLCIPVRPRHALNLQNCTK